MRSEAAASTGAPLGLPADFAALVRADFAAATTEAVREAGRQNVPVYGRDAQGRLVSLSSDGQATLLDDSLTTAIGVSG